MAFKVPRILTPLILPDHPPPPQTHLALVTSQASGPLFWQLCCLALPLSQGQARFQCCRHKAAPDLSASRALDTSTSAVTLYRSLLLPTQPISQCELRRQGRGSWCLLCPLGTSTEPGMQQVLNSIGVSSSLVSSSL